MKETTWFCVTMIALRVTMLFKKWKGYIETILLLILQYTNFIPSIFWKGLDLLCWKHGKVPWEDFPNITLTLAASHNTSLDLVVSPRNYLRPIGDEESGSSAESDCYKFSVAPSDSGTY